MQRIGERTAIVPQSGSAPLSAIRTLFEPLGLITSMPDPPKENTIFAPSGDQLGKFPSSLWSGVRLKPGRSRRHPLRTRRVCTRRRAVADLIARKGYLGTAGRPISREVVRQVVCELGPSRAAGVYRVNLRVAIPAVREDYLAIRLSCYHIRQRKKCSFKRKKGDRPKNISLTYFEVHTSSVCWNEKRYGSEQKPRTVSMDGDPE